MATVVTLFTERVFALGITKSAIRTPPVGTNLLFIKAPAVVFRSSAGVGTAMDLAIEISPDAGVTWNRVECHYDGGGATDDLGNQTGQQIVSRLGEIIDYVSITASLGNTGGATQADPSAQPAPRLSDANTRVRAGVRITGGPVTMGPGTVTLS